MPSFTGTHSMSSGYSGSSGLSEVMSMQQFIVDQSDVKDAYPPLPSTTSTGEICPSPTVSPRCTGGRYNFCSSTKDIGRGAAVCSASEGKHSYQEYISIISCALLSLCTYIPAATVTVLLQYQLYNMYVV